MLFLQIHNYMARILKKKLIINEALQIEMRIKHFSVIGLYFLFLCSKVYHIIYFWKGIDLRNTKNLIILTNFFQGWNTSAQNMVKTIE